MRHMRVIRCLTKAGKGEKLRISAIRASEVPHSMSEKLFLRPAEVGELIGCSRTKVYELINAGTIPSVRIGGLLRVPAEALRRLAQSDSDKEDEPR
jgi:excisionase family DNA binding protein